MYNVVHTYICIVATIAIGFRRGVLKYGYSSTRSRYTTIIADEDCCTKVAYRRAFLSWLHTNQLVIVFFLSLIKQHEV